MSTISFKKEIDMNDIVFRGVLKTKYSFDVMLGILASLTSYNIFERNYKNSTFLVTGELNNKVFALYDYKNDNMIHISASKDFDMSLFLQSVENTLFTLNQKNQ